MMCVKCFGILVEVEGEGGIADIAVIAVIARDRENQSLPRIDADERGSGISWNPEVYAILGWPAMRWDTKGGAGSKDRGIAVIG